MKKLLSTLIFFTIILIVASKLYPASFEKLYTFSYCDQPISYRVDTIDSRFGLSRDGVLSDVADAAQIWNSAEGKNLFILDPKGDLSINLIYDERQYLTTKISQMENTVQSEKQSLKPQVAEFQKQSADLSQKIAALNAEVEMWNSKGGAPEQEFDKIIQKQQELKAEEERLNVMAKSLNMSANEYNSQVNLLNNNIKNFNNALEQRPEEGIFKGPENRIEIYFSNNKAELIHTLAHELGHALGISHVANKKAIMYSKTSQTLVPTDEDIAGLKNVCKKHTIFELFLDKFSQIRLKLASKARPWSVIL